MKQLQNKHDIPTPALLVDLDLLDANIKKVADLCKARKVAFRPHAKTHKCPELGKRQVAAGALGISVATVPEAEAMARAGIRGVLLTSPIIEPHKIERMVDLARRGSDVMLAITHAREAELLEQAASSGHQVTLDVLIDIDVGDRRTGALPGEPVVELARAIAKCKHLRLRGIQAYAGHASHAAGFDNRAKVSKDAWAKALDSAELLKKAGFDTTICSGGSTGTYNIDSAIPGVTELQVGSYVFMDLDYRRIGGQDDPAAYKDFQFSLSVLTTVVSTAHKDAVTVDAGIKAFATDVAAKPEAKARPGLIYSRTGDEFGRLTAEGSAALPKLGDRLEFYVPHCDPTVNLYDRLWGVRGDKVEAVWPIAARRENG
jgi:D-serine deaminase-like pyridoxal phosphate-dependent protein